jgi:hypothetical protein
MWYEPTAVTIRITALVSDKPSDCVKHSSTRIQSQEHICKIQRETLETQYYMPCHLKSP